MINKNSQKLFINPISSKERLKGFTIIEVLIVIAIIGLLTTIVLVSITSTRAKARDNRRMAELLTLGKSLEFYYSENGQYPESADWIKIEENATFTTAMAPYISATPEDPSYGPANEYSYQYTTEATGGAEYKACATMETYEDPYCLSSVFGGSIVFDGGAGGGGGLCVGIDIYDCAILDQAGETYCLTRDIINSATSSCINITANNITFDGQGHTIDGDDVATSGVYLSRATSATTSITIKNCTVSDWDDANIYLERASGNTLNSVISTSGSHMGIHLYYSHFNTLSNITASSNDHSGIYVRPSHSNILSDITASSNGYCGIQIVDSTSSTLSYITANLNNSSGVSLFDSDFSTLSNIVASNNSYAGIGFIYSDFCTLSNITADSNGSYGVSLYESHSNALSGIAANLNNNSGVYFHNYSRYNTLSNVIASNNDSYGFYFNYARDNTIENSTSTDNGLWDFYIYASLDSSYCAHSLTNVIGTGNKPIFYHANSSTTMTNSNNEYSEIVLCNADGSILNNITLNHTALTQNNGILLMRTDNANLTDINVNDLKYGLQLTQSNFNTFTNVTSTSNSRGIYFNSSDSNSLSNIVSLNNNYYGIYYLHSDSNNLSDITASNNNSYGIGFSYSYSNIIENSNIINNTSYGIYMYYAGSNTIYNNKLNNATNFSFEGTICSNNWSTSTPFAGPNIIGDLNIGGNHWITPGSTGYSDTCADTDSNGFCDTPYDLLGDGTNIDNYPLKKILD